MLDSRPRFMDNDGKMLEYPVKILVAFGESIKGNEEIHEWLLNNGYPELGALSNAIRGSDDAFKWLMKFKPELAALDSAIDNDPKALLWLNVHKLYFLEVFADACRGKKEALQWLGKKDLKVFLRLAQIIKDFRDRQTYDYHKMHF